MRNIIIAIVLLVLLSGGIAYKLFPFNRSINDPSPIREFKSIISSASPTASTSPTPAVMVKEASASALVPGVGQVPQTFNNCGPATLSMIMTWAGNPKNQQELGRVMRPYQNPQGDNDDKSINSAEFTYWAQQYGMYALHRPNGTPELLKTFVSNGIPVVIKSWLHPNEDIGHFRIIKGYDDNRRIFIQDDSYDGPNLTLNYDDFLPMWQPFNYEYFIVVDKKQQPLVDAIIGAEKDEQTAWRNALARAEREASTSAGIGAVTAVTPTGINPYPAFNQSVAHFYLGNYAQAVAKYEEAEPNLPWRMLWYQIEPIQSYQKVGNAERVFTLTDDILNNNNRGFAELYLIRGQLLWAQGNTEAAREQFALATQYNPTSTFIQAGIPTDTEPQVVSPTPR